MIKKQKNNTVAVGVSLNQMNFRRFVLGEVKELPVQSYLQGQSCTPLPYRLVGLHVTNKFENRSGGGGLYATPH